MNKTHMIKAINAAISNDNHASWRLACVVTKHGKVLSIGYNKPVNSPRVVGPSHHNKCSIHAEEDALSSIAKPEKTNLYIARITPGGQIALAKPCNRCYELAHESGVKNIYWTIDNTHIGSMRLKTHTIKPIINPNHRIEMSWKFI